MKKVVILICLAFSTFAQEKPNIILIMSDDHTTQAIGAYGARLAALNPTPALDSLAQSGMRFDRVFCNNAICTPSRASIISGQYSQTNGVLDLNGSLPATKQYLPIELKKAGYQTAVIGKWHLKKEPAAFDYYNVLPGQGDYFDPIFRIRGDKKWGKNTEQHKGKHSSDAITDVSLEWLKNGRDKTKPFFLMHHFKAPHDMFENAKRYDSYLENIEIPEPGNLHNQPAPDFGSEASRHFGSGLSKDHQSWGLSKRLGIDQKIPGDKFTKVVYQKYLKRYLRCVKGVDDNIQRLVNFLKKSGLYENTIIIYTSDQGFFLGEHDLMDKRWMYEEAFRMPFIVHYPKVIKAASVNDWLINNTDFAPTILELAGINKTPDYMQGRSFARALKGETKPGDWRQVTYYRYWMHLAHQLKVPAHFGVRSERYKLIFFYGHNYKKRGPKPTPVAWEFYDLENDPHEMNNQYKNPEYKTIITKMKDQLQQTRKQLNETDINYPNLKNIIEENWDL